MSCCEDLAKKHEAAVGHFKTEIKKLNERLTELEAKCANCQVVKAPMMVQPTPVPVTSKAKAVVIPPKKAKAKKK